MSLLNSMRRRAWRLAFAALVGAVAAQIDIGGHPPQVSVVAPVAHDAKIATMMGEVP